MQIPRLPPSWCAWLREDCGHVLPVAAPGDASADDHAELGEPAVDLPAPPPPGGDDAGSRDDSGSREAVEAEVHPPPPDPKAEELRARCLAALRRISVE